LKDAIFANSHSAKESEEWMKHVAAARPDAVLAILLPTMVRLEKLDLMLRSYYTYFDRMVKRAVAHEQPFDKQPLFLTLTEFMHGASWEPDEWELDDDDSDMVLPPEIKWKHQMMGSEYTVWFQNFPRMRSIFSHRLDDMQDDDFIPVKIKWEDFPTCDKKSSSLTHLELKGSFVNNQYLYTLLEIPKALLTFIYEIYSPYGSDLACPIDVLSALAPQHESLENLWLDCWESDDLIMFSDWIYEDTPSLSKFIRLKNLKLASEVLCILLDLDESGQLHRQGLSGLLPATLETLHIRVLMNDSCWSNLRVFILAQLDQVPRLQKIFIECSNSAKAPLYWTELKEHAKSKGVDLISLIRNEAGPEFWERGWGMDGSIKWARCVHGSNMSTMPLIRDWNEARDQKLEPEDWRDQQKFFYKWHLCHDY
jgi:hypothetical protein